MTTEPSPTRRDLELQLIKRAWTVRAFVQQLQENPHQAVEAALGVQAPSGLTIQVLQESPTTLHLVGSPRPDSLPEGELTDADLIGWPAASVPGVVAGTAPVTMAPLGVSWADCRECLT
jgi:hypothetical protein